MTMIFYGVLTAALTYVGYKYTNKFVNVTEQVGAFVGAVAGVTISVGLWYTVGKKFVESSSSY